MINERQAKKFCCEDIALIENYNEAVTSNENWDVHHKLGLWFKRQWLIDNGFYYDQRSEMLVFMKHNEHRSLHHTGNLYCLGRHLTEETKRKLSESHKGKHCTDEHRRKLGEARKGKHLSEETKRKMSAAQLNHPARSKPVSQFTKSGEFVATYPSIREAARQTEVNDSNITRCCNGKLKSTGGFIWRRAD